MSDEKFLNKYTQWFTDISSIDKKRILTNSDIDSKRDFVDLYKELTKEKKKEKLLKEISSGKFPILQEDKEFWEDYKKHEELIEPFVEGPEQSEG